MDGRENATVLAALRHWQNVRRSTAWAAQVGVDLINLVTDTGKLVPLNDHEIDELCERINTDIEASVEAEAEVARYGEEHRLCLMPGPCLGDRCDCDCHRQPSRDAKPAS
jgi:hypothetical protein